MAGRSAYLELGPLQLRETGAETLDALWLRGGFPESFTARSEVASLHWRHLLLVRRLAPWHANVGKRLVRSPKMYVRDSGLVLLAW